MHVAIVGLLAMVTLVAYQRALLPLINGQGVNVTDPVTMKEVGLVVLFGIVAVLLATLIMEIDG